MVLMGLASPPSLDAMVDKLLFLSSDNVCKGELSTFYNF